MWGQLLLLPYPLPLKQGWVPSQQRALSQKGLPMPSLQSNHDFNIIERPSVSRCKIIYRNHTKNKSDCWAEWGFCLDFNRRYWKSDIILNVGLIWRGKFSWSRALVKLQSMLPIDSTINYKTSYTLKAMHIKRGCHKSVRCSSLWIDHIKVPAFSFLLVIMINFQHTECISRLRYDCILLGRGTMDKLELERIEQN